MDLSQKHRASPFRTVLIILVSLGGMIALAALGYEIVSKHQALRSAPTDNVQWSLSQSQVELLMLDDAINHVLLEDSPSLRDVRQRFDIFYSRINTLQSGQVYSILVTKPEVQILLMDVRSALDELLPLMDGPDLELRAALSEIEGQLHLILPKVRTLSLDGVALFAGVADRDRQRFSNLLLQTGLLALLMIAALLCLLVFLVHQTRQTRRQSEEVVASNQRYASMVNSSLDAIVVSDAEGSIIDFNPAAESTFGYSRNAAIGQKMHNVIIPHVHRDAHQAGMKRFLDTGVPKVIGAGRVELEALRSDGSTFLAELSIGTAGGNDAPIFIGYIRDISQRVRTQAELTKTRDLALAAAKAKSEFLAVMSHEMRTPLNGVMGILDLLAHTDLTAQQRHYLTTAVNSGEILQGHINDVLDITSIEAGAMELQPTLFELEPVLDEIAKINEPAAALRGNRIELIVASEVSKIAHDRGRLGQVVMNLVGNAVKFTSDGTITIAATLSDVDADMIELSVSDTGVGMAASDCDRIFDDFVMLDPSYQRTSQGTGLGLAISRRIVEAMKGEIGVTSSEGEGSRFWLRIPTVSDGEIGPEEVVRKAQPIALSHGLHVLLVEDNETNRLVAREMLTRAGCTVSEAHDGVEGVERAQEEHFDLILMDISMPRMDGITATRNIRGGDGLSRQTPIVGLTAHAMARERVELFEVGMQDCLIKPLRDRTLRQLLSKFVGAEKPAKAAPLSEESVSTSALDPAIIDELVDVLPDDLLVDRLSSFHAELVELENGIYEEGSDDDGFAKRVHRHAGSAAVFGAHALRRRLLDLETAATEGKVDELSSLAAALTPDLIATRQAIEEMIEALGASTD